MRDLTHDPISKLNPPVGIPTLLNLREWCRGGNADSPLSRLPDSLTSLLIPPAAFQLVGKRNLRAIKLGAAEDSVLQVVVVAKGSPEDLASLAKTPAQAESIMLFRHEQGTIVFPENPNSFTTVQFLYEEEKEYHLRKLSGNE